MHAALRAMIVPFVAVLFPALHIVYRAFGTAAPDRLILGVFGAILVALLVAVALAWFRRRNVDEPRQLPRAQRILQPEDTALRVFGLFAAIGVLWATVTIAAVGPSWIAAAMSILVAPLGAPLIVLGPLAIGFYWAVVLGYVLSVLWMSLLATVVSDLLHARDWA